MLQDRTNTAIGAGSSAPGWRTNTDEGAPIIPPPAQLALIAPPSAGEVDEASDEATVAADGNTYGNIVITPVVVSAPPGGSGVFTPTSITLNSLTNPSDGFSFTPDTVGNYSIGITNNAGLTNPDPFTYQAQSPYVAPELENNWIVDLHPLRSYVDDVGEVPAGSVDHAGEKNAFNVQTQYAGSTVKSAGMGSAYNSGGIVMDADSMTRNGDATHEIIVDPDNPDRNCYVFHLDKTATGWLPNGQSQPLRAQIPMTGDPRRTRPWGARTWLVTAVRIPAFMAGVTSPGFICLFDWHTSQNDLGSGGDHAGIYFNPGGSVPTNSSLRLTVNTWSSPNWPSTQGDGEGPKTNKTLFAGGSNVADQVPLDEWIFIALDYRLWHGFQDPNTLEGSGRNPVPTPTGPFYIKPYVAVGDAGPIVPKPEYTGTWGYPYGYTDGWDRPAYCKVELYCNPKAASNWTELEILNLGMREWLVSDIEAENPGREVTAHDIIAAFRASRLVTPA